MLKLEDFFHLPQLDALIEQLVADQPGLTVVAGLDPRPLAAPASATGFLPSGRTAIFRILIQQILELHPKIQAVVVTEDRSAIRVPRQLQRRVKFNLIFPSRSYASSAA